MTPEQIQEITKNFADLRVMNYVISGLYGLVLLLFSGIVFFLKRDFNETHETIKNNSSMCISNQKDIETILSEMQHSRAETDKVLRILALHTGANIGFLVIGVSIFFY